MLQVPAWLPGCDPLSSKVCSELNSSQLDADEVPDAKKPKPRPAAASRRKHLGCRWVRLILRFLASALLNMIFGLSIITT